MSPTRWLGPVGLLDLTTRNTHVINLLEPGPPKLIIRTPPGIPQCSSQAWGSPKPSLAHGVDLFHQPPSLRTSSRGRWAAPLHRSDLPFWQETRALHPARKTGSRRGGEPRVSTESALTAPTWLPRATCLFPGKSQPPHHTLKTQISLLIRYNQLHRENTPQSSAQELCTQHKDTGLSRDQFPQLLIWVTCLLLTRDKFTLICRVFLSSWGH